MTSTKKRSRSDGKRAVYWCYWEAIESDDIDPTSGERVTVKSGIRWGTWFVASAKYSSLLPNIEGSAKAALEREAWEAYMRTRTKCSTQLESVKQHVHLDRVRFLTLRENTSIVGNEGITNLAQFYPERVNGDGALPFFEDNEQDDDDDDAE